MWSECTILCGDNHLLVNSLGHWFQGRWMGWEWASSEQEKQREGISSGALTKGSEIIKMCMYQVTKFDGRV